MYIFILWLIMSEFIAIFKLQNLSSFLLVYTKNWPNLKDLLDIHTFHYSYDFFSAIYLSAFLNYMELCFFVFFRQYENIVPKGILCLLITPFSWLIFLGCACHLPCINYGFKASKYVENVSKSSPSLSPKRIVYFQGCIKHD